MLLLRLPPLSFITCILRFLCRFSHSSRIAISDTSLPFCPNWAASTVRSFSFKSCSWRLKRFVHIIRRNIYLRIRSKTTLLSRKVRTSWEHDRRYDTNMKVLNYIFYKRKIFWIMATVSIRPVRCSRKKYIFKNTTCNTVWHLAGKFN